MKKLAKRFMAAILMAITLLCVFPFGEMEAEAVSYKELQRFEKKIITVSAGSNYYFDKWSLNSSTWVADCIPKGTKIGSVEYTVVTSQTTSSNNGTVFGSTNYGKTWGDAINIGITVKPCTSISVKQYISSNYNMSGASVWGAGSTFKYYVGTEDLYNYIQFPAPSTNYGYLSNWSPNYNQDTSGWDTCSFGLTISSSGASLSTGKSLTIKDSFVDGYDYTNQNSGLFKVRYDYKKYNGIGYCSSDRRAKIFGNTTVYNSLDYRAVKSSLGMSKYIYVYAKFTVCDSKSWPTEIKGYSNTGSVKLTF